MTRPGLSVVTAALCALAAAGCSDDTGILIEVHGEELATTVARLDTIILMDDGQITPSSDAWGNAQPFASEVNADLRTDPYTVLLEPEGVSDQQRLYVAAIAYGADEAVIGFGQLDASIAFSPDVVKKVALHLRPAASRADCIVKGSTVVVRYTDDCDGDQAPYWEDCDDLDAAIVADTDGDPAPCFEDCAPGDGAVYPGAEEVCDGKDTDCDDSTHPEPYLCAAVGFSNEEVIECRVGQAVCGDVDPGSDYECATLPIDVNRYLEICNRWAICNEAGGDPTCLVDAQYKCRMQTDGFDAACVPSVYHLHDITGGGVECSWQLVGNIQQAGWNVGLRPFGSDQEPLSLVEGCDAELVVTASDLLPRIVVLEQSTLEGSILYSFLLAPESGSCGDTRPTLMECEAIDGI